MRRVVPPLRMFALLAAAFLAGLVVGLLASRAETAVALAFSGVVALSTVVYAVLTKQVADETRELRRVETEPRLSIYAEPSPQAFTVFDLVIKNVGRGPAYRVSLVADREWTIFRQEKLADVGPFKHGIGYLAPGQEIRFFVGQAPEMYEARLEGFGVTAKYGNYAGELTEERFLVGFKHYWDISRVGEPPNLRVAKALEKIADRLGR